jgi:hypothetical protein
MRLTLRTMLAYQDSVLEPNEAEELGRKIKESDFAAGLMQRMRSVLKKLRMNAPKLDGKGMGNDANTVAEYLDSALPQDRVGDFERICLESDAHLAEVAGCHQILTLVLGKPADVPERLRERVYAMGNVQETPAVVEPASRSRKTAAATNGRAATRPVLEVPDYLRDGRQSSFWRVVGGIAIALLVVALLLRMMGPFNSSHPVLALLRGQAPVTDETIVADTSNAAAARTGTAAGAGVVAGTADEKGATADREIPPAPVTDPPMPVEAEPAPVEPVQPADLARADVPPEGVAVVEAPSDPVKPTAPPSDAVPPPPAPAAVPDAPAPMDVGRFISDEQVLAHMPADDGIWIRVPARAVLSSGEVLVSLPAFRPQIALASGVQVTLAGETALQLLPPTEEGASRMMVDNGRLVIVTAGAAGAQVALNLAGVQGVATLVDADSALAVSVKLYLPPGADPLEAPVIPVIELFNTRGRVAWDEAGQERVNIPTHHVRIYAGADPAETAGPFAAPEWIDAKNLTIERQSALMLEGLLVDDKPLNLSLAEALEHRQVDVRALAARCLAYLDNFEPVINQLSDPRQSSFWAAHFAALRQAMQRGPGTAAKVRDTLERLLPDQSGDLYRLLVGYSPDQLNKDGGLALVEFLRSDHMDVRVLALQNLVMITGAMEFYMPQKKPDDLKASIQSWKMRQAKGTITYRTPPTPLEPYKPLERPPVGAADLPMTRGAVAPIVPPLP